MLLLTDHFGNPWF